MKFVAPSGHELNPGDLWPAAVDIQTVARFARAVADLTLSLTNAPAV